MRSVRQLHVSHCQQKVLAAALQPHARPALQVVPDLLAKAGARKIRFTAPVGQLREREALWTFDSVEVTAWGVMIGMSALARRQESAFSW